jgi:hypothetical protein
MHTKLWSVNLKVIDQTEELSVDGKKILEKYAEKLWTGFSCLRIGTSGGLL